jgi:glycolate oxidase iron-sulfur subunit
MQGLAMQQLPISPQLLAHLDHCLDCRNCEHVCPAGVEYENLLDTTRYWLKQQHVSLSPKGKISQRAGNLLSQPQHLRRLNNLLWLYQSSGLQWLLDKTGILRLLRLDYVASLLPRLQRTTRFPTTYEVSAPRGRIALFTGCLGSTLEQATIKASLEVLHKLGLNVEILPTQTCCGALAWHEGDNESAMQFAQQNLQAFDPLQVDAILYTASGCGAHLVKYKDLPWHSDTERDQATAFTSKLKEISAYLEELEWPAETQFRRQQQRIAVHEPCSERNGLRQTNVTKTLLSRIPDLDVETLSGTQCCGAAGNYMLKHPEMASKLRTDKLDQIKQLDVDLVVSTNPGCSLFLNAGLERHTRLKVVHPVIVLAEYLLAESDTPSRI